MCHVCTITLSGMMWQRHDNFCGVHANGRYAGMFGHRLGQHAIVVVLPVATACLQVLTPPATTRHLSCRTSCHIERATSGTPCTGQAVHRTQVDSGVPKGCQVARRW